MAFTPLNALNSFLAVARRRSFAAAARDLGVSTSALSQAVRQLEARLGVTLLTRTSRTVAPTEAGQRLLENAGPAVDQALESLQTVTARRGEITGRIRLSIPTVSVAIVAPAVQRFIYFPSRSQVSPAFRAFVDIARELSPAARRRGGER